MKKGRQSVQPKSEGRRGMQERYGEGMWGKAEREIQGRWGGAKIGRGRDETHKRNREGRKGKGK